ncbi:MAG: PDZ domain-containing protein [Anaerolineae bacterium]
MTTESRFSGKQVLGIVIGALVLLGAGLGAGGLIGYRWGQAEGARQAASNQAAAAAPVPDQNRGNSNGPQGFTLPFGQVQPTQAGGAYLGVEYQMITPELAATEGITGTTGALIRSVVEGSPAATAGLKAGEVITAVDGQTVDAQNDLRSRVANSKPNDEITLTIVKGTANGPTDSHDVKVKLGERPATQDFNFQLPDGSQVPMPFGNGQDQTAPAANGPYLGVEFESITADVAAREGITGTTGALIRVVVAGSPAAKAGLKKGDVITAVNGTAVDDQHTLRDAVQQFKVGDEITLTVVKGTANGPTDSREVKVTLGQRPAERQFQMPPGFNNDNPGFTG